MIDNPALAVMRERRSVRNFTSDPVTDEQIEAILEAGRWAPSGLNSQPWAFVVVRDPRIRAEIGDILRRLTFSWKGFATAPALIVVSVDPSRDPGHFVEDGAVAAQNMCLAAQSLGLASSWAGIYTKGARRGTSQHALKTLLSLPRPHRIVAVIPIGVARHEVKAARRPLAEMVHHDRFHSVPVVRSQSSPAPSSDPTDGTRELPRMRTLQTPAESGKLV